MHLFIRLSREEIQTSIPYALIAETRESARWNTGARKRAFERAFREEERAPAKRLANTAREWALRSGPPENLRLTTCTLALWKRLGAFCASDWNEPAKTQARPKKTAGTKNIKVIIEDGIVQSVLTTDSAGVDVEIVDICEDYEDAAELKAYRDLLFRDGGYKEMDFTVARFTPED